MSPQKIRAAIRNRANGTFFEIRVLNIIRRRRNCLEACRSAGSRGLFDVWAITYGKFAQTLCVCKRNGYVTLRERKELAEFMREKPSNVEVEYWWYKTPKKIAHCIMRTPEDWLKRKFSPTIFN
jgi:hypothetical protein